MKNHTEVLVSALPACDFCGQPAHYDARTVHGSWANLCPRCFPIYTYGMLGLGFGQRLVLKESTDDDHQ